KGFVVTTKVYDDYLESVDVNDLIFQLEKLSNALKNDNQNQKKIEKKIYDISEEIRSKILNGKLGKNFIFEIDRFYSQLGLPLVAVRSSATAEDLKTCSFAGQYETHLNQKGLDQIINSIKNVWASTYGINVINYRNRNNIKHSETKMAVLIQKMVDTKSSGRAYSIDIETGLEFITIKNLNGLGEAEASGISSPDTWVVDQEGNIIKRSLGKKQFRIEYDSKKKRTIVIENEKEMQKKYVLTFVQVKELSQKIQDIHKYFLKLDIGHVEIEYAITPKGKIFITQARPETSWNNKKQTAFKAVDKSKIGNANPIIFEGGSMGWGGVAVGTLRVLSSLEDAKKRHKKGDIIVVGNTTNAWENIMVSSSGLISQEDVISSHAVATTREEEIPSVVGHMDAIQILKKYDGQVVTLDATSRKIYLGKIEEKNFYFPERIKTVFQGLDVVSEDEHWKATSNVNLTSMDSDGKRWLKRPVAGTSKFQHEINIKGYDWISRKAGLPQIKNKKIEEGILQVSFSEAHRWREILREKELEYFEWLYNERVEINKDYIKASRNLKYNADSVRKWINCAIKFYGIQHLSYSLAKITDGFLHNALAERKLLEPYLCQVYPSMERLYGETLSKERVRFYKSFLTQIRSFPPIVKALCDIVEGRINAEPLFKKKYSNFYRELEQYAKNYRVTDLFNIDFSKRWFLKKIAYQLIKDFDAGEKRDNKLQSLQIAQEFFPDDLEFQKIARVAILIHKLKLDTNHLRRRGHWKFREFIIPFGEFLKEKGVINKFCEIFDHKPEWLVD
ncbi:MAG: PEP/pyruvate-binding domain-containing protein, partial [Candidatus Thorarchaeota archaeon]